MLPGQLAEIGLFTLPLLFPGCGSQPRRNMAGQSDPFDTSSTLAPDCLSFSGYQLLRANNKQEVEEKPA